MRRAVVALGVAVAILLTGCVGIPTSGGVNDGAIIDEEAGPEFVVQPSGPRQGSTPQEILEDFMQAVRGPQNGYAIAKLYLTANLAATWEPDAGALIRTGAPSTEQVSDTAISYTISSRANVNAQGQYTEERQLATQTLTFEFAQENGEWRISKAADGIVLSQASFFAAFREQALYFFDPTYSYLVPDVRWFPSRTRSVTRTAQALLSGPSAWLQQAVVTAFPEATALGEDTVVVDSGTTVVDLGVEALASSPEMRDRMRQQLAATLDTPNVEMTVRGLRLETPAVSGDLAVVNPLVDAAALVGDGEDFGFDGGTGIAPVEGISGQVVDVDPVAATLTADKRTAAVLSADGSVYAAIFSAPAATLIDDRAGLIAPSIDPDGYVWSARGSAASSLTTFDLTGEQHAVQTGLADDSSVLSIDVSRDGTRILILLDTAVGTRLVVAGIVRQDELPIQLGEFIDLPVTAGDPVDATWVDDRTVAAVTAETAGTAVTVFEIGGPSSSLGTIAGAVSIAGGNAGTEGLRVLSDEGELWRPRGSEGWVSTSISASFLGIKH